MIHESHKICGRVSSHIKNITSSFFKLKNSLNDAKSFIFLSFKIRVHLRMEADLLCGFCNPEYKRRRASFRHTW
jgi:hypothetical protein